MGDRLLNKYTDRLSDEFMSTVSDRGKLETKRRDRLQKVNLGWELIFFHVGTRRRSRLFDPSLQCLDEGENFHSHRRCSLDGLPRHHPLLLSGCEDFRFSVPVVK